MLPREQRAEARQLDREGSIELHTRRSLSHQLSSLWFPVQYLILSKIIDIIAPSTIAYYRSLAWIRRSLSITILLVMLVKEVPQEASLHVRYGSPRCKRWMRFDSSRIINGAYHQRKKKPWQEAINWCGILCEATIEKETSRTLAARIALRMLRWNVSDVFNEAFENL